MPQGLQRAGKQWTGAGGRWQDDEGKALRVVVAMLGFSSPSQEPRPWVIYQAVISFTIKKKHKYLQRQSSERSLSKVEMWEREENRCLRFFFSFFSSYFIPQYTGFRENPSTVWSSHKIVQKSQWEQHEDSMIPASLEFLLKTRVSVFRGCRVRSGCIPFALRIFSLYLFSSDWGIDSFH